MHKRLCTLLIKTGGLLGAGLFYAFLCFISGGPLIPCLFHLATGFYCPGCGVSRMCLALLKLDLATAFRANAAILLLLPPGLAVAFQMAVRYVKEGKSLPTPAQTAVLFLISAVLFIFGILRNLPAFSWMAP